MYVYMYMYTYMYMYEHHVRAHVHVHVHVHVTKFFCENSVGRRNRSKVPTCRPVQRPIPAIILSVRKPPAEMPLFPAPSAHPLMYDLLSSSHAEGRLQYAPAPA